MEPTCPFLHHALKDPLKHGRATDNTTLAYKTMRISRSHFMMLERSAVDSAGTFTSETWLKTLLRSGNVGANSDDVSVWELIGFLRFELCVVIRANIAKIFSLTSRTLSLSAVVAERELSLSRELHQILCEMTANQIQTKDGVRRTVTSVERALCATHRHQSPSQCPSCVPERT